MCKIIIWIKKSFVSKIKMAYLFIAVFTLFSVKSLYITPLKNKINLTQT